MSTFAGILVVVGTLAILMGLIAWWQKRSSPHPELSRKLLHLGMGVVTLSFPWLFDRPWPVIFLALLAAVILYGVKSVKPLSANLGQVMGGVKRKSFGEFYFPLAVALVFVLSNGDPVLYCLPVLVLTASDTGAALVGTRFGTKSYTTIDGIKSAEGSIAFFLITFAIIFGGLFTASIMSPLKTLLTALTLSGLLTLIEAISWQGLDNLFVPLGSFVLLQRYVELDLSALVFRLVLLTLLSVFVLAQRQRTTLTGNAFFVCILIAFTAWVLTDWHWLVAPLTFYLLYAHIWPPEEDEATLHDMQAVGAVAGPAMLWILFSRYIPESVALFSYSFIYAAHMVVFGNNRYLQAEMPFGLKSRIMRVVPLSWALFFIPYLFDSSGWAGGLKYMLFGLAMLLATIWLLQVLFGKVIKGFTPYRRWVSQSVLVAVLSLCGLLLML